MQDNILSGLERLAVEAQSGFVLNPAGRILRVNAPDKVAGPRFYIAGCADGNLFYLRYDVSERIAKEICKLARGEPPLCNHDSIPVHMAEYVALLERDATVVRREIELGYVLPNNLVYSHSVRIVRSGTREGDTLRANLRSNGVPEGLREMGFKDEKEFWEPWCVAFQDSDLAAIAFAARLGEKGAAIGVATARAFRGKGFAAAAAASWTCHPRLAGLGLSFSHNRDNRSSQRVAERLGLTFLGVRAAIH
jgi:hypothetical protein